MTKLLLLDRDGTITQNRVRPGDYINDPNEIELIPGVLERLEQYNRDGWTIVVVSNQGGVEKGFITLEQCIEGFKRTIELSEGLIKFCLFCPEAYPALGSHCYKVAPPERLEQFWPSDLDAYRLGWDGFRKPYPDMLVLAQCLTGADEVLMVGDRDEDQKSATYANVPFQWAEEWRTGK